MHFSSEQQLDGVVERSFTIGEVPGLLWTSPSSTPEPAPLILLGLPGGIGLQKMYPRIAARARAAVAEGYAAATIELPGSGDRPRIPALDEARTELQRAVRAGEPVPDELSERLVLPLVDQGAEEWRVALDALLTLPELSGRVGLSGGLLGIGVRLAATEPRLAAAVLFAGSFVPRAMLAEARRIVVPVHVMLQWDDDGNDRQLALDLFDAIGSEEKTLHANLGGHTGIPALEAEAANRFLARHLR